MRVADRQANMAGSTLKVVVFVATGGTGLEIYRRTRHQLSVGARFYTARWRAIDTSSLPEKIIMAWYKNYFVCMLIPIYACMHA